MDHFSSLADICIGMGLFTSVGFLILIDEPKLIKESREKWNEYRPFYAEQPYFDVDQEQLSESEQRPPDDGENQLLPHFGNEVDNNNNEENISDGSSIEDNFLLIHDKAVSELGVDYDIVKVSQFR